MRRGTSNTSPESDVRAVITCKPIIRRSCNRPRPSHRSKVSRASGVIARRRGRHARQLCHSLIDIRPTGRLQAHLID